MASHAVNFESVTSSRADREQVVYPPARGSYPQRLEATVWNRNVPRLLKAVENGGAVEV